VGSWLIDVQKVGNWFRHRYQARKEDTDGVEEIIRAMSSFGDLRPKRQTDLSKYFELYWDETIKPAFEVLWEGFRLSSSSPKKRVSFVRKFTAEAFSRESEEVHASIREICDEEYEAAMEAWRARTDWKDCPESYRA